MFHLTSGHQLARNSLEPNYAVNGLLDMLHVHPLFSYQVETWIARTHRFRVQVSNFQLIHD